MYKVPRERTKERKRPFVNSLRFKPPLKTLFELRKCVFRERRRIESREKLFVWLSKTNRKKRVFPQKQSKREEGVGVSIRLFRPLVLKKAFIQSKLVEKKSFQNENSQRKRKNEKRGRKSTDRESFIFPSKQKERKTTYSYKREYNKTCALSNALFRRRRRRERSSFSSRNKEVLLAYARLGVLCSREREREILLSW